MSSSGADDRRRPPFAGALWASGFRAFFLFGTLYGLVAMGAWFAAHSGAWTLPATGPGPGLWHGHEMVFGFATAIICGLLLTALPSWAGVRELIGRELALLAALWLAGRAAVWLWAVLPMVLVAAIDSSLLFVLAAMLAPGLLRVSDRKFLVVLPVLVALGACNLAYYAALAAGPAVDASRALDAAVGTIVVLYSLVGGFMTPIFTENALRERGLDLRVGRSRAVELAAHASAVGFAIVVAVEVPPPLAIGVALTAFVAHALRLAGWRGWRVSGTPLVLGMHVGYLWLVVAFGLHAGAELGPGIAPRAWLHAVTIGAVGMMMLALMPRVALRHTGRALALHPALAVAYVAMSVATLLRLAVAIAGWGSWAIATAAGLWAAAFAAYLAIHGPMLVRPSLPRSTAQGPPRPPRTAR